MRQANDREPSASEMHGLSLRQRSRVYRLGDVVVHRIGDGEVGD